jgi:hypothetical protein
MWPPLSSKFPLERGVPYSVVAANCQNPENLTVVPQEFCTPNMEGETNKQRHLDHDQDTDTRKEPMDCSKQARVSEITHTPTPTPAQKKKEKKKQLL